MRHSQPFTRRLCKNKSIYYVQTRSRSLLRRDVRGYNDWLPRGARMENKPFHKNAWAEIDIGAAAYNYDQIRKRLNKGTRLL